MINSVTIYAPAFEASVEINGWAGKLMGIRSPKAKFFVATKERISLSTNIQIVLGPNSSSCDTLGVCNY